MAVSLAFAAGALPVHAEVPSLDAYAGQALVLGTPHHHRASGHKQSNGHGAGVEASGTGEMSSQQGESSAAPTTVRPPSGGGGSGGTGGSSGAGGSGGSGGAPQATHSAGAVHVRAYHANAAPTATADPRASDQSSLPPAPVQSADALESLSGANVLLIVLGTALLLGVATALRRTRESF